MQFNPYLYKATIVDVYDGDTVRADIDLGFSVIFGRVSLRLYGIDTPELRGDEREQGLISRDALRSLIFEKEVLVFTHKDKTGKYGRYLAEIFLSEADFEAGKSVNKWLVENGYAVYREY